MSTQQDIYAAGSKNHPPMLNKENYEPWLSCLLRYANSRPNGKLIHNSILNGPYVRKVIPEPGDANRDIITILLGLPEDIYAAVDSCETAQEIWLRVQQMMKGSDIGIQEKKAKLFNEWERFTSNEGELIESYYHRFLKLMNDLKRNKHFPEKIASNLKFLNNLQPEWSRHEVDELKAERLAKTQDPLALMANSNNPYVFPAPHQDQSSFNQNYLQQPMPNPEDITDPTTPMNMALMVGGNVGNQFRQYTGQNAGNPTRYNDVIGNQIRNGNLVAARAEGNATGQNGNQIRCYNCRGVEEQYTELLEPIPESHQVPQNDNDVISEDTNVEQEKKKLKSDFKTCEDELLDKQIQLEKKIKELNNILLKMGQSIQTIHMLSPKPNSFYHTEQKMALGYQNPFYLKQAQKKQQSLYDGKVLLEKHDPPVVHDSEETP
nr:hypothetical protein [Tanacetum cinerariifolium]